ncbi:hypothetical protein GQ44DRAFT_462154 [Phaeosphaeriaceae sp. PMI808]|nr:hypothetical protein GQ44DRAFT_462154 [Phaeosphaeriaceae sp. PMI808]
MPHSIVYENEGKTSQSGRMQYASINMTLQNVINKSQSCIRCIRVHLAFTSGSGLVTQIRSKLCLLLKQLLDACPRMSGAKDDLSIWMKALAASDNKESCIEAAGVLERTDFSREQWRSLSKFYQSTWFFRVWVVQEIQQSQEAQLLCGDLAIDWGCVALAATKVRLRMSRDGVIDWRKEFFLEIGGLTSANLMWNRTLSTRRQVTYLYLLRLGQYFNSTDPRDKVFALLHHYIKQHDVDTNGVFTAPSSLLTTPLDHDVHTHLRLRADYNLTTLQVYREVAVQSIR